MSVAKVVFMALLLSPVGLTAWLVYDRVEVMRSAERQPATITRCQVKRKNFGNSNTASFAPVATTRHGLEVEGGFAPSRKKWCQYFVGDEVEVFVVPVDESKNRIHSFLQFYLAPLGGVTLSLVLLLAFVRQKMRR